MRKRGSVWTFSGWPEPRGPPNRYTAARWGPRDTSDTLVFAFFCPAKASKYWEGVRDLNHKMLCRQRMNLFRSTLHTQNAVCVVFFSNTLAQFALPGALPNHPTQFAQDFIHKYPGTHTRRDDPVVQFPVPSLVRFLDPFASV